MFSDLKGLLSRVATASESAREGAMHFSPDDYGKVVKLLELNARSQDLLRRADMASAGWIEDALRFFYEEFVADDQYAFGKLKRTRLRRYSHHFMPQVTAKLTKKIAPFIDLCAEYDLWRAAHRYVHSSCLIVTALPLEFRAVARRLSGIIDVRCKSHPPPNTQDENTPPRKALYQAFATPPRKALYQAFAPSMDSLPGERPFWLVLEGVVGDGTRSAGVTVILLPQYGGLLSQRAVDIGFELPIDIREILVVGVAGRLGSVADIGDVVISKNIYDITLQKKVPKQHGLVQFVKCTPWEYNAPTFCPSSWTASFHVEKPTGRRWRDYKGFQRIVPADVASGASLSKALWFKRKVQEKFPSCVAIEMEAAGCCTAAAGKPVRVIKGLCDRADYTKSKEWQPYCADRAAAVAADYIIATYGSALPSRP